MGNEKRVFGWSPNVQTFKTIRRSNNTEDEGFRKTQQGSEIQRATQTPRAVTVAVGVSGHRANSGRGNKDNGFSLKG